MSDIDQKHRRIMMATFLPRPKDYSSCGDCSASRILVNYLLS